MEQDFIFDYIKDMTKRNHNILIDGNKLQGKKKINTRKWANFSVTFFKTKGEISISCRGERKRIKPQSVHEVMNSLMGLKII